MHSLANTKYRDITVNRQHRNEIKLAAKEAFKQLSTNELKQHLNQRVIGVFKHIDDCSQLAANQATGRIKQDLLNGNLAIIPLDELNGLVSDYNNSIAEVDYIKNGLKEICKVYDSHIDRQKHLLAEMQKHEQRSNFVLCFLMGCILVLSGFAWWLL